MGPLLVEPERQPELGIIAFHDAGACPEQFDEAFEAWQSTLPATVFYAPRAPMPCFAAMCGYQWYDIDGIGTDNRADRLSEGVEFARQLLKRFGRQFELPPAQVVAAGYSQGAVILLGLAAEAGNRYFGQLLSFAGQALPEEIPVEPRSPWPQVDLFHGELDDVVPVAYANDLFNWLSAHGADPSLFVEYYTEHELTEGVIRKAADRLRIRYRDPPI